MQTGGAVALNYESMAFAFVELGRRFGRFRKAPLAFVFLECHGDIVKKEGERSAIQQNPSALQARELSLIPSWIV